MESAKHLNVFLNLSMRRRMRITPINNHQQSLITFQQGEWGILSRIRRMLLWKCIAYPLSFFGTLSGQLLAGPKTFSFPRTTLFVWGCPGNIFGRSGRGKKEKQARHCNINTVIYNLHALGENGASLTAVISACLMHIYCAITFVARGCPLPIPKRQTTFLP